MPCGQSILLFPSGDRVDRVRNTLTQAPGRRQQPEWLVLKGPSCGEHSRRETKREARPLGDGMKEKVLPLRASQCPRGGLSGPPQLFASAFTILVRSAPPPQANGHQIDTPQTIVLRPATSTQNFLLHKWVVMA